MVNFSASVSLQAFLSTDSRYTWSDMVASWRADMAIWLILMLWFGVYRLFLATSFASSPPWAEMHLAMLEGSRFDSVLATAVVLPSLAWATLGTIAGSAPGLGRLRRYTVILACFASALVYGANYEFFRNLGSHLDQRTLDFFHDDDGTIAGMIWQAHHPLAILFISLVLGMAMAWSSLVAAHAMPNGWPAQLSGRKTRLILVLLALNLVIGLLRGFSWDVSPVRTRNAFVTSSMELNRVIPSPVAYWLYALEDWTAARAGVSGEKINRALETRRQALGGEPGVGDLAAAVSHQAEGGNRPPRHIFILLLEGQHGFPLLPGYRELGWMPHLADLADRGAYFPRYISSGGRTNNTLSALISGTFTPDFVVMYDRGALRPTLTALAPQFRQLGYQPRFFYGGYQGWSGLDKYLANQGFDEQQGAPHIRNRTGNAWGAWDGELFDHVLNAVDPARPSLNLVLTTTNHSPYDLPTDLMPPTPSLPDWAARWDEETRRMLGHERYADREVGRFVAAAEKKFPDALFVIVGDHPSYGGDFALPGNPPLARLSVPMLLYGSPLGTKRGNHATPASTLDILPTLMELSAPLGYRYFSLGKSLFAGNRADHALGQERILGPDWMADAYSELSEPLVTGAPSPADIEAIHQARAHHDATRTLSRGLFDLVPDKRENGK